MSVESIVSSVDALLRSPNYEEQELQQALNDIDPVSYDCSDPTFILGHTTVGDEFFDAENKAIAVTVAQEQVAEVNYDQLMPPSGVDIGGQLADALDGVAAGIDDSINSAVGDVVTIVGTAGNAVSNITSALSKILVPAAVAVAGVIGGVVLLKAIPRKGRANSDGKSNTTHSYDPEANSTEDSYDL